MSIRNLRQDEIDLRVQSTGKYGETAYAILLLYKDARCDMNILDEVYGIDGWQRKHEVIDGKMFCTVSIKDIDGNWISKQDVGTESNTEKEKGQVSDSFKRACFNFGIGRELYTAPSIFVSLKPDEYTVNKKGETEYVNLKKAVKFFLHSIMINNEKQIIGLKITDKSGTVRFEKKA
jgi:hypothetical protein